MSRRHRALNPKRWQRTRHTVLDRDGWRCRQCGKPGILEVDHVVPLHMQSDQDPYDPDGCQTLCRACHIQKTRLENEKHMPGRAEWRVLVALRRLR